MKRGRGRPRSTLSDAERAERRRAYMRAYTKTDEYKRKRREYERAKRANETPTERADRLAYRRAQSALRRDT